MDAVPARLRLVTRATRLLLAAYLATLLVLAVAAGTGRFQVGPFGWANLGIPLLAFGQAAWSAGRSRRATEPARRREFCQRSVIQSVIGLILLGSITYYWTQAPGTYS
ncbi:hypothetical protein GCM10010168_78870 [Actinoplanes ianthinogenes]|uniref:Uncharacterized protein n=1 Tax=Actinoplanes ianthinogenes TaxID=122358 RepID=A0ABM7LK74_9ACTN|nr:hypothetical protein [Actinoplanes ianthinogenes]BCJ39658.1 hypothetical protein Aiant_03150 [Actinoplanes ianthinogenes]GGR48288.1 hypothetical protein GCM10010168_78870 [Actinoplanes ianthinogenes]